MGRCEIDVELVLDTNFVKAGQTLRFGGVSKDNFSELNLAFHVGDKKENVIKNREILAKFLDVKFENLVFMNQIHSDKILVVDDKFLKQYKQNLKNLSTLSNDEILKIFPSCDALITNLQNVGLCVMVADCSPVLIIDEKNGAIAAIHAGRAGVCAKILTKTALKMHELYTSKIADLRVFVGANIKRECYEIRNLDLGEFNKFKNGENFDMDAALKSEMLELGIVNFSFYPKCTHCDNKFFSYRKDGVTGRFCGFVVKK